MYTTDNKVSTSNFSSEGSVVEYFKYSFTFKWDFKAFKEHMMKGKMRKPDLATVSFFLKANPTSRKHS